MKRLIAVLALVALAGCGRPSSTDASPAHNEYVRPFIISYQDGTRDTVLADAIYYRGWNGTTIELMRGWDRVAYITRPATIKEARP